MSEFDDDEFEGNEENGPKALRDLVKKLKAENAELKTENTGLKATTRKTSVAAVLAAKGLPEKLANLYTGEPDEASVDAWASEYADVFGVQPAGDDDAGAEGASEEDQQQFAAMSKAASTGVASAAGEAALQQKIAAVSSVEELDALIASGGR
jgi:hypothetical protein